MPARTLLIAAGLLVAAAVLGGGTALGLASATGSLGGATTVTVERAAPLQASAAAQVKGAALSVNEIYRQSSPGVVQITSTTAPRTTVDPFFGFQTEQPAQQALGSGFVVDKAGHIVTNYHVVEGAQQIEVSFSNQDTYKAKLVGTDPSTDLALLQVDVSSRALTPLALADSDGVRVGDPVVAIGNPFGLDRTATAGIVSALQRNVTAPERQQHRPRDPDRRADQPGQLGRAAPEQQGRGRRRQLADLEPERRRQRRASASRFPPTRSRPWSGS